MADPANVIDRLSVHELFGANTWAPGEHGTFDVTDPATRTVVGTLGDAGSTQATRAVDAAVGAGPQWARATPRQRSELLYRVFELMCREARALADVIVAENGKSRRDADAEVLYAAEFFRWFAEEAVRPGGDYGAAPVHGARNIITHRPVGVAALVTPWNFPAAMVARKVAPALAAGCTVVVKPAEETPLTALAIARLVEHAGAPPGVINVVTTTHPGEVVGSWLADPRVRKLSFTGSTAVGRQLLRLAADRVVNCSMELGGNAPFIVTADADVDQAVDGAFTAKFRGGGQACTAANRFYIHEAVADQFVSGMADRVSRIRVGPGHDPTSDVGPLITERAVRRTTAVVDGAIDEGARVAARADLPPHCAGGTYFAPVLLSDVAPEAKILQDELFAPVAPVVEWADADTMLELANATEMALAGYVYSRDLRAGVQLAERLEVGMVGINRGTVSDPSAPFGGMKQSGLGREGARIGLEEYQEVQSVSLDWKY